MESNNTSTITQGTAPVASSVTGPDNPARSRPEKNRENAANSTGPRTETGKQKSKFNARRHNLTGQVMAGTVEEMTAYFSAAAALKLDLQPVGELEARLVQSLAGAQWQLDRARSIENNIIFAAALRYTDESDQVRDFEFDWAHGQAKAFLEHAKELDLISRYATRYHRQVLQIHERLAKIQKERINNEYQLGRERKNQTSAGLAALQQAAAGGQASAGGPTAAGSQTIKNKTAAGQLGFVSQPKTEPAGAPDGDHGVTAEILQKGPR